MTDVKQETALFTAFDMAKGCDFSVLSTFKVNPDGSFSLVSMKQTRRNHHKRISKRRLKIQEKQAERIRSLMAALDGFNELCDNIKSGKLPPIGGFLGIGS